MIIINIASEEEDIIQINKKRMHNIKSFSKDYVLTKIDGVFKLANYSNIMEIQNTLEYELFFERIDFVKIEQLVQKIKESNKPELVEMLLSSYLKRGYKGFDFSWMPILLSL